MIVGNMKMIMSDKVIFIKIFAEIRSFFFFDEERNKPEKKLEAQKADS